MKTFKLTTSQCKAVMKATSREELNNFVESMSDQPSFMLHLGKIEDVAELISLWENGCAATAHKSVYYYEAQQCMLKESDSIELQLEELAHNITWNVAEETFSTFCSQCCVLAVEGFVSAHSEIIEVLASTDY